MKPTPTWRRYVLLATLVSAVLSAAVISDYVVLNSRIGHVHVAFHWRGEGQTWVIVGSDSRQDLPSGPAAYGTAQQAPGQRADVILVIHQFAGKTAILSIPRDVLVSPADGQIDRLTLTLNRGPQPLVDGLCRSLGIGATHLVIVTMKGFAKVVNALGGVDLNVPQPIRDVNSNLLITRAGDTHLDGLQALALVRSRQPELLTASGWVGTDPIEGAADRTRWAGVLFSKFEKTANHARFHPLAAQRILSAAVGDLTTDQHTELLDLLTINFTNVRLQDLPLSPVSNSLALTSNPATAAALASSGFGAPCR